MYMYVYNVHVCTCLRSVSHHPQVVEVKVQAMTLLLEERLLFKLLQWAGLGGKRAWSGGGNSEEDEIMNMLTQRL